MRRGAAGSAEGPGALGAAGTGEGLTPAMLDPEDRLAFERLLQWLRLSFLASPALVVAAFGAPALPFALLIAAATMGSFGLVEWVLRRARGTLLAWQLRLRVLDCALVAFVLFAYHAFLGDAYYDSVYVLFVCAAAATHGRRGVYLLAPTAGAAVLGCRLAHVGLGVMPFQVRHLTDPLYYGIFFVVTGLAVAHLMERSARAAERREAAFRAELGARNEALERTAAARDEALERAQQAVGARDALLAAASHDLKNPLTVILGTVQLLESRAQEGRLEPERDVVRLARIRETAGQMVAQLEELVDAARDGEDPGSAPRRPRRPTDLVAVARRAAVVHAEAAGRRPLRLETETDTLVGEWDPVGLGRVVDNLLSNAIKYSPDSPEAEIRLRLRKDGDEAILSVRDHGRGIPEGERKRVFERFFRASNAAATPGTGVGLAAARQIVEETGGRLSFASWDGEGTEFTVTLPMGGG